MAKGHKKGCPQLNLRPICLALSSLDSRQSCATGTAAVPSPQSPVVHQHNHRITALLHAGPQLRRRISQVCVAVVLDDWQQLRPARHARALLPPPVGHLRRRHPLPRGVPVRDWGRSRA